MGDLSVNVSKLQYENYRHKTFENEDFTIGAKTLAQAGFYSKKKNNEVECFTCHFTIEAKSDVAYKVIIKEHKTYNPKCPFVRGFPRKTFQTLDSLRYEEERLATFIDWPVKFLKPSDLAKDGFYYLRTMDKTACKFCRGVVGAWEEGDNPRGEHMKHFPRCPFIRGQAVGNVTIEMGNILDRIPYPTVSNADSYSDGEDVCGTGNKQKSNDIEVNSGKNFSTKVVAKMEDLGMSAYHGPQHKEYLAYETRLTTFTQWPPEMKQKPEQLADAGFFSCNLSDHVRCFHCGHGLRNWEKDESPWVEHARWFPKCHFVQLKKGQDFVDQVKLSFPTSKIPSISLSSSSKEESTSDSPPSTTTISSSDVDRLMDLDVIRTVLVMGFSRDVVHFALTKRLKSTGQPFTSLESCIEMVIQSMEEMACAPNQKNIADTSVTIQHIRGLETSSSSLLEAQQMNEDEPSEDIPPQAGRLETPPESIVATPSSSPSNIEEVISSDVTEIMDTGAESNSTSEANENKKVVKLEEKSTNTNNKQRTDIDKHLCKVCYDCEADVVFLPCRHILACGNCVVAFTQCPVCREDIKYAFKPIWS